MVQYLVGKLVARMGRYLVDIKVDSLVELTVNLRAVLMVLLLVPKKVDNSADTMAFQWVVKMVKNSAAQ